MEQVLKSISQGSMVNSLEFHEVWFESLILSGPL